MDLKDENILRAGIVPYLKSPNEDIFLLFGLDEGISSLSDFGGTREYTDLDVYHLALREYREETIDLLEPITLEDLKAKATYVIADTKIKFKERCVLFFYPFEWEYPIVEKMKAFKKRSVPGDETKGLVLLSLEQTKKALEQPKAKIKNTKMFLFHPKIKNVLLHSIPQMQTLQSK